jgi:hypothetical protein
VSKQKVSKKKHIGATNRTGVSVFRQRVFYIINCWTVVLLPFAQIEPLNTVVGKKQKKNGQKKNTSARTNRTDVSVWDRQQGLGFLNTRILVFCWAVVLW